MLDQVMTCNLHLVDEGLTPVDSSTLLDCGIEDPCPITIAIPAYNEERFVGSVVIQAHRYTPNVVVIDDGSKDDTAYIAERAGALVIRHPHNAGKSEAVNSALRWARGTDTRCLVFIDGDGQHRPDEIDRVVEPVLMGEADMVIGSRFLSVKSHIPTYRKIGQAGFTALTNVASAVPVTDSQSGFRAFSRKAIEALHFNGTGLSVESEMQFQAKEHGLSIVEVPISVVYAEKAKRNPFAHGMQIIDNILHLVGTHRPFFFFGIQGLMMLIAGAFLSTVTVMTYSATRELAIGYALISVLLLLLGMLSVFVGLILHAVRSNFVDLKKVVLSRNASTELQ
jgi:glycosyltransferase involved in cell wall biosynthesis